MKKKLYSVSVLLSALTFIPLYGMSSDQKEAINTPKGLLAAIHLPSDQQKPTDAQPLVKTRGPLTKYINLKSFFCELGAVFWDDNDEEKSYDQRTALLRLCLHLRFEELPSLFSIDKEKVALYFKMQEVRKFVRSCSRDTLEEPTSVEKAIALKKCFNIPAWETLLGCKNLEQILSLIIDLYYFTGTAEEKVAKLRQLKQLVQELKTHAAATNGALVTTYFNVEEIEALLADALEQKAIARERYTRIISCPATLALFSNKPEQVNKFTDIQKLLNLMVTFMLADSKDKISWSAVFNCVRWENLLELLPILMQCSKETIDGYIIENNFKQLIASIQNGQPITREALLSSFNAQKLQEAGFSLPQIDRWINIDGVVKAINDWRQGTATSLTAAVDIAKIEERLGGIDVRNALNLALPEQAQFTKMCMLADHFTNTDWMTRLRCGLPFLGIPVALWLAGRAVAPSVMNHLEPSSWYTAGPLALGVLYGVYRGTQWLRTPTVEKAVWLNTVLCKGMRLIGWAKNKRVTAKDILHCVPEDNPFKIILDELLKILKQEHYESLPSPFTIIELIDNPFTFIDTYPAFIEGLCTIDPRQAEVRMRLIAALCDYFIKDTDMAHYDQFRALGNTPAFEPAARHLPNIYIILIAQYRPGIFMRYPLFLAALDAQQHNGRSILSALLEIIEKTKDPTKLSKISRQETIPAVPAAQPARAPAPAVPDPLMRPSDFLRENGPAAAPTTQNPQTQIS